MEKPTIEEVKLKVIAIAQDSGYKHFNTQEWCLSFSKIEPATVVNVYWNKKVNTDNPKFTVQTALTHPRRGKTQLNRKDVSMHLLEKIFSNPRVHTHKGYYKK